jgi:hypothetical protein
MSDERNIRLSGRHGKQWGDFTPTPLTRLPINWGVICFYGALLLAATVALVKLYLESKQ